ncbi:superoxide dismutase family protein [Fulvivirga sediminis]|uniref:Superoxide dismutase family protein n=1 Tax=Fulvivirga sediminis TaxID=2803949 RepID=A0A937FCG7_9BACT|nr:superoxide dismutase family protein [Fulvivirga sediminis]MBL3658365.1 superoxide dismutase family protein [Fulvivirga sediminis]
MRKLRSFFLATGIAVSVIACSPGSKDKDSGNMDSMEEKEDTGMTETVTEDVEMKAATAMIEAKSDSEITGTATFTETPDGIAFEINVENAEPGEHAVHIHEKGDCSAADGKSAGGHWNPTGVDHGKRGSETFHKGDIGNMTVGEDGKGSLSIVAEDWTIGGEIDSNVVGKAVIIHAGADDFTSQPSGAAGARIGCGVINAD